ncbi:hypothetical protein PWT90_02160 [Aphanocladium album]|nr:hypothetical protein PWT90_02160 [Aphanocladium album]
MDSCRHTFVLLRSSETPPLFLAWPGVVTGGTHVPSFDCGQRGSILGGGSRLDSESRLFTKARNFARRTSRIPTKFLLAQCESALQDNQHGQLRLDKHTTPTTTTNGADSGPGGVRSGRRIHVQSRFPAIEQSMDRDAVPKWDNWVAGQEDVHGSLAQARGMVQEILAGFLREIETHCRRMTVL